MDNANIQNKTGDIVVKYEPTDQGDRFKVSIGGRRFSVLVESSTDSDRKAEKFFRTHKDVLARIGDQVREGQLALSGKRVVLRPSVKEGEKALEQDLKVDPDVEQKIRKFLNSAGSPISIASSKFTTLERMRKDADVQTQSEVALAWCKEKNLGEPNEVHSSKILEMMKQYKADVGKLKDPGDIRDAKRKLYSWGCVYIGKLLSIAGDLYRNDEPAKADRLASKVISLASTLRAANRISNPDLAAGNWDDFIQVLEEAIRKNK